MSEKRFTSKDYTVNYYTEIVDNEKELDTTIPNPSQRLLIGEAVDLLNEYEENLQMCREKALYWRNKAENIFGDMKTNVELQRENIQLKKENQTIYCQLNNFKLCKWDLEEENKLLKQALRESLQSEGNAVLIKTLDKLFQLNYNQWNRNPFYEDWDETLTLKELRDQYE